MKTSEELRQLYKDFWTSEPRNFKEVPNVSLVPNNDPTLLFVNSGMFPLNPYLSGQPHPLGTRLFNFQRCLRTKYDEMLEVGDNRHTLMFEMMGDWSLGDFTKEQQIPWIMDFWISICGLDPKRLYVSVFEGNEDVGRDEDAIRIWKEAFKKYGVEAEFSEDITKVPPAWNSDEAIPTEVSEWKYRIFPYPKKKNWWQRAGDAPGELGGPTSEMFYDMGEIVVEQDEYHINDDSGRFIEIGNNVFTEYKYSNEGAWEKLEKNNIDFGGGFERVVMIVQNKKDIFETDIYAPVLEKIAQLSGKSYKSNNLENEHTRYFRILADHSRAATFILADGVIPSNKDQGYILRRFIRRLVRYGMKLGIEGNFTKNLAESVIEKMKGAYPQLEENKAIVLEEIDKEETKFRRTLANGLKEIEKMKSKMTGDANLLDGKTAFFIYETYGFPLEMTLDEFNADEEAADRIGAEFELIQKENQAKSKAGAGQKFKGGLADQSVETKKLHTAHHLLLKALQIVLGEHVHQRGSNITGERLRIDFSHSEKLTEEQIKRVEEIVNEKIREALPVYAIPIPYFDAESIGAEMEFGQKYPTIVTVYFIGGGVIAEEVFARVRGDLIEMTSAYLDRVKKENPWFSAEFCGGPHVLNTKEIGEKETGEGERVFKIVAQENVGAGARRIKAKLV